MGVARLTDNERIARWAHTVVPIEKDPPDLGDIIIAGGNCSVWTDCGWQYWDPDTDITLWHGLLAEIERRGKWLRFIKTFAEVCGDAGIEASLGNALVTPLSPEDVWGAIWTMLRATPSQLAAALVKVIEGGG